MPDPASDRPVRFGVAIALAVAAAVVDCLGFVGFGLFPLTWIAKVPALVAARRRSPRGAFLVGLLYGATGHLGGYYWLKDMLVTFGGLPAVAAAGAVLLLATYLGLIFALLLWCVRRAERDLGLAPVWTLLVAYPAIELVFPSLFPYRIGASQYRFTAIAQIVEVTGMLGLTALVGAVNGAVYELVDARLARRRLAWRRVAVPAALFLAVLGYGVVRLRQVDAATAAAPRLTVGLVQTGVGAREKAEARDAFVAGHLRITAELLAAHPEVALVVWPETAVNVPVLRAVRDVGPLLRPRRPMVVGALTGEWRGRDWHEWNSVLAVGASGQVLGRYDKVRLLAFGESIPLSETFPALRAWFPRSSVFERGRDLAPLRVAGTSLLPLICYEDILPDALRDAWRAGGPAEALVNVTNDSWYGDTQQPLIHLALATFRSIEARRALIRATNTGISAVVDPAGRIVARTGQWTREALVAPVPLVPGGGATPYLAVGDALGWACLALTAAGLAQALRVARRRARPAPAPAADAAPPRAAPRRRARR